MEVIMKYGLNLDDAKDLFENGYSIRITLYYNNNDGFFSHCYNEKDFDETEILIFQKIVRQILKRFDAKLSDLFFEVA